MYFSKCIEAPEPIFVNTVGLSLFLAGGITGCPPWQDVAKSKLLSSEVSIGTIYNPRRENFPISDSNAAREQIEWEFKALNRADMILFWFHKEQIQPIALFELGRWSGTKKKLFVGADPEYSRRQDVEIQLELARPDVYVYQSLENLLDAVSKFHPATR
jgi:hypothetical protein